MMNHKPNEKMLEHVEMLIEEARKATPELSKKGINYDHKDIVELLSEACLHQVLTQVLAELRFSNQGKRNEMLADALRNGIG